MAGVGSRLQLIRRRTHHKQRAFSMPGDSYALTHGGQYE